MQGERLGANQLCNPCLVLQLLNRRRHCRGRFGVQDDELVGMEAEANVVGFRQPAGAGEVGMNLRGFGKLVDVKATLWMSRERDDLAGDPESAFGGVLVCNREIDSATAEAISSLFFEVLIAPSFSAEAMAILTTKKNRILLQTAEQQGDENKMFKSLLNGVLLQDKDGGNFDKWEEAGARPTTAEEKEDLLFANLVCKHLKSNAIALVKNRQLLGKGCGQTSRIDALRQAVEKARQFNFNLSGAVMASDAFFPFDDCVKLGHEAGITAFIQPGGSIRDKDSIEYCKQNGVAMVMTGLRHFKH